MGEQDIVEPGGIVAVTMGPGDKMTMVPILGEIVSDETIS